MAVTRSLSSISVAPVRGFRLEHSAEVALTEVGVVENRRFFLVDGEGRRLRSSLTAWPVAVRGHYDADNERLLVRFPDGTEVEGSAVASGAEVVCDFGERTVRARIVEGEWSEGLSRLAGHPVEIARPDRPGECFAELGPVTLLSEASVGRLSREAGTAVDGRRFRMLLTLAGCEEHEEDTWDRRLLRVGDAALRVGGPVDRCAVTTRDPDTGERDLDTFRLIKRYRGLRDGQHVDFGVYARVERPGVVCIGDPVELLEG